VDMFRHRVSSPTFFVTKVVCRYRVTLFGVGDFRWPPAHKHIRVKKKKKKWTGESPRTQAFTAHVRLAVPKTSIFFFSPNGDIAWQARIRRKPRELIIIGASRRVACLENEHNRSVRDASDTARHRVGHTPLCCLTRAESRITDRSQFRYLHRTQFEVFTFTFNR